MRSLITILPAGALPPCCLQTSSSVIVTSPNSSRGHLVAPVLERPLGELHDVALVHQGDALAARWRWRTGSPCAPAACCRTREIGLMPMPLSGADLLAEARSRNSMTLLRLVRARRPLDAGVDVLGVLAEDHHVDLLGLLHRRGDALEVAHRAHAGVEVEDLAQGDVEAADAAADRRGQRPLDGHAVVLDGVEGVLGQPVAASACRPSRRPAPRTRRSSRLPP